MSGSKGNAVSPLELLEIYEPNLLRWLYSRKSPDQSFELAFNTDIYRQYDEYDAEHTAGQAIPFRQAVGFGQVVQWQADKIGTIIHSLGLTYSIKSIEARLPLARNWLTKYNAEEMVTLNQTPNHEFFQTLNEVEKGQISRLYNALSTMTDATVSELEILVYDIPKTTGTLEGELKKNQRQFFKNVYTILIGREAGPRLGTFLWATDRAQVLTLLAIAS